jgi:hypothetical protein
VRFIFYPSLPLPIFRVFPKAEKQAEFQIEEKDENKV